MITQPTAGGRMSMSLLANDSEFYDRYSYYHRADIQYLINHAYVRRVVAPNALWWRQLFRRSYSLSFTPYHNSCFKTAIHKVPDLIQFRCRAQPKPRWPANAAAFAIWTVAVELSNLRTTKPPRTTAGAPFRLLSHHLEVSLDRLEW